ncbi:MAG: hypothetical protein IJY32_06725 [Mogibacterium sp.]|nr:hypothetical protein [Mogibacterium sp.]
MRNPNRTANKRRAENEENVRPDTLIVANSRYGSSNQYTQWLIDRLGADAMSYNKQQLGYTSLYRNIIWVGAIRDAVISNVHMLWLNHHNFGLDGKKIIICGVGIGDPENPDYFNKVMARSGCGPEFCSRYILPGRIDQSRLRLIDRPQFDKFLIDSKRIYGEETHLLVNERAADNYNGVD